MKVVVLMLLAIVAGAILWVVYTDVIKPSLPPPATESFVQPELPTVAEIKSSGKKRWIIYNKNHFTKEPGAKINAMISAIAKEEMPHINGAIIESETKPVIGQDTDSEWVVEEEQIYTTRQANGCSQLQPTPTPPCPSPTPPCEGANCGTPAPTPPAGRNKLADYWWSRGVHNIEAQDKVETSGVTVCIIDTGVDINHQLLAGRLVGGASMIGSSYQDDQGHGSHVAGIVAGVSMAKIYSVKALDRNGSGMSSWIANAEVHCADKGFKIISMSLGSDYPDSIIQQATQYAQSKGSIIVAAAGNSGGPVGYPAGYQNVIAVAAIDQNNKPASFTSRGPQIVFASYGVNIESVKLGGGTVSYSGTSMATPNVAGVMAFAIAKGKTMAVGIPLGIGANFEGKGLADALATVQ